MQIRSRVQHVRRDCLRGWLCQRRGKEIQIMRVITIRRIATLEEVAAMATFLAGPQGGYITGGVIDIAGGLSI